MHATQYPLLIPQISALGPPRGDPWRPIVLAATVLALGVGWLVAIRIDATPPPPEPPVPVTRYEMSDGTIVDSTAAAARWDEPTRSTGDRVVGMVTSSRLDRQRLYRTRRGRFWLLRHRVDDPTEAGRAEWLDTREAVRWLLLTGHDIPVDLRVMADELLD